MDLAAALARDRIRVVVEGLVEGLEEAIVDRVQRRIRCHVHTEEDPVGVTEEELPARVGLSSELAEAGRDVDEEVRVRVEEPADEVEVLGGTSDMSPDERRRRVPGEQPSERREQVVELRVSRGG